MLLWHRPVATAPIRPLAWESPCASGAALEKAKKTKSKNKKKQNKRPCQRNCDLGKHIGMGWWAAWYTKEGGRQ